MKDVLKRIAAVLMIWMFIPAGIAYARGPEIASVECIDRDLVRGYGMALHLKVCSVCGDEVSDDQARGNITGYAMKGPFGDGEDVDFSDGDFSGEDTFEVRENGNYCFAVRDDAGRQAVALVRVDNIDRTAPVISGIESSPRGARGGYGKSSIISVYAYDTASRLAEEAFSFDDGRSYGASHELEVKENGIYYIRVRDGLGNVSRAAFEVYDIDDEAPVLALTGDRSYKSADDVCLNIKAGDERSGIDSLWYEEPGGEQVYVGYYELAKEAQASVTLGKNGEYRFFVRDGAGNESSAKVEISSIDKSLSSSSKKSSSSRSGSSSVRSSSSQQSIITGGSVYRASSTSSYGELVINSNAPSDYDRDEDYFSPSIAKNSYSSGSLWRSGEDEAEEEEEEEEEEYASDEETDDLYSVSDDLVHMYDDAPFYGLEKEYIEGEYEEMLSAPPQVSENSVEKKVKKGEKSRTGAIVAAGVVVVLLCVGLLLFILARFGIINIRDILRREEADSEEDED